MTNKEQQIPIFLDTTSNLLKHPVFGKEEKEKEAEAIVNLIRKRAPSMVERYATLPPIMVHHGEYCDLLREARSLFIYGYFYSCVAMCGIVAERIVKDIFQKAIFVRKGKYVTNVRSDEALILDRFPAKEICNFLIKCEIIDKKIAKDFEELGVLRNKYVHAGAKASQDDAELAIKHLHRIVENTVSVFKNYSIKEGKLVPKRKNRG